MASDPYQDLPVGIQRSLAELHELINLAEQVSYDLDKARSFAWKQVGYVAVFITIIAGAGLAAVINQPTIIMISPYTPPLYLAVGCLVSVLISVYCVATLTMIINRRKWRLEREIVSEILIMSSSILESIQNRIGSVEYTLLKMRMRRLGLSDNIGIGGIRFA